MGTEAWWWVHNLIAHPLLVLWPSLGERLHDWTAKRARVPLVAPVPLVYGLGHTSGYSEPTTPTTTTEYDPWVYEVAGYEEVSPGQWKGPPV